MEQIVSDCDNVNVPFFADKQSEMMCLVHEVVGSHQERIGVFVASFFFLKKAKEERT